MSDDIFSKKEYPYTVWVNGRFYSHCTSISKARMEAYRQCELHPKSAIDIFENDDGKKGKKIATVKNNGLDVLKRYHSYSTKKDYYLYKDVLYDYKTKKAIPNQSSNGQKSKKGTGKAISEYTISDWNREEKAKTIDEARMKAASMLKGSREGSMTHIKHGYRKELNGSVFRKGMKWVYSPSWKGKPRYFDPKTGKLQ